MLTQNKSLVLIIKSLCQKFDSCKSRYSKTLISTTPARATVFLMLFTNILFSLNTIMIMVIANIITMTITMTMTMAMAKNMNISNDDCCYG